jgi:enoyl-CoA hydratase
VITGSDRAFAAGADIREMQGQSFPTMNAADWFAEWAR